MREILSAIAEYPWSFIGLSFCCDFLFKYSTRNI